MSVIVATRRALAGLDFARRRRPA